MSEGSSSLTRVFKDTVRASSLFTVSNFFQKGLGLLLLPVYTRFLSPIDYGYIEILMVSVTFANLLLSQGMPTALLRNLNYVHAEDRERQQASIGSAVSYVLVSMSLFLGTLCLLSPAASDVVLDSRGHWPLIVVGGTLVTVSALRALFETVLFAEERMTVLAAGNFGATTVKLLLNILFVVVLQWGYPGIIWSHLLGDLVHASGLLWLTRDRINLSFDAGEARQMLGFGLPMVLSSLSLQLLFLMDRYFLGFLGFKEQLGIYAIANKFTDGFRLAVLGPFTTVWGAKGFKVARESSGDALFGKVANLVLLGGAAVAVGCVFLGEPVLRLIVAGPFVAAHTTLAILIVGAVLYGAADVVKVTLAAQGESKKISAVAVVAALANFGLNATLIPRMGAQGAAYATLVSFGVLMLGFVVLALRQRILVLEWTTASIALTTLAALLMIRPFLDTWTLWQRLLGTGVTLAVLLGCVAIANAELLQLFRGLLSPSRPVSVKQ